MLHILLLILKIIGIILGALLGVLFIGLCIALFVPVRYQIEASRTEAEGAPPIEASAKITWLLHLVNIRIQYPADVYLRARIFLFTVFRWPQKPKNTDSRKKRRKKEPPGESKESVQEAKSRQTAKDRQETESSPETKNAGNAAAAMQEEPPAMGSVSEPEPISKPQSAPEAERISETGSKSEERKKSILEKLKEKIMQIREIFQKIWYTLTGICDKIKTIRENIEYYLGILQSDTFKGAFALCKKEVLSIFSYIMPRKFQAELTIGTDDPAVTGKILSYYGILYPFIGGHIAVIPDFERKRIEGTVFIKGKIRLFTFIKAAIRIYFNKDIRKLLKLFKKEDL